VQHGSIELDGALHMHPAIGMLSDGRYYAFLDGYQAEPTYASCVNDLEQQLRGDTRCAKVDLSLRAPAALRSRARTLKTYLVEVTLKYPSATHSGCTLSVDAYDQKQAISLARQRVRSEALYDRHDGPLIYQARRAEGGLH